MRAARSAALRGALVLTALAGCSKVHFVSSKSALEFADRFYLELKAGNLEGALALYDTGLATAEWRGLLVALKEKLGDVTVAELERSHVSPRNGVACVFAQYHVLRQSAPSTERLIVCPSGAPAGFVVSGHEMVNPAGSHVSTGLVLEERGVSIGP